MTPYILGIDGGGTKTAACAVDLDGRELFRLQAGALNLNGESPEKVGRTLRGLLEEAEAAAGPERRLAAVGIGAAGLSNPQTGPALRKSVEDSGFGGPLVIKGDHMAALAGALGREPGLLLIAGTGSICVGRAAGGREARAGGRGHLIDDEGSGYAIGRDILRAVIRAGDGRSGSTCLTELVEQRLGISGPEELVGYVYRPDLPKSGIAMLAELLEEGCRREDPAAIEIRESAAEQLALLAQAAAVRLGLKEGRLAAAGSVLQKNIGLRKCFERRLGEKLPGFSVIPPARDAAVGAALLAMEALEGTESTLVCGAHAAEPVDAQAIAAEACGAQPPGSPRQDAAAFDRRMSAETARADGCVWLRLPDERVGVWGLGFFTRDKRWNRLPLDRFLLYKEERPALAELSRHMAGGQLRFCTGSRNVWVRAILDGPAYMSHMTPAAQCGFDCYVRFSPGGDWHFAGLTKFPLEQSEICCLLAGGFPEGRKEFCVNLPLYTGIRSLELGLDPGELPEPPSAPACEATIAFYGTSITQGGCAGRSGMAYPAIVGRAMDAQVFNFGFSGNGVGTPCLAPMICGVPGLGALVVDIEANAGPEGVLERNLPLFLNEVRRCAPGLPVLVLSGAGSPGQAWDEELVREREKWTDMQRREVEKRVSEGDQHIHYADAAGLIGKAGGEATEDGVHLNDLGFYLLAQGLVPILKKIME